MLKLLRTLKNEKSSGEKDDPGTNKTAATPSSSTSTITDRPDQATTAGWQQFSSKLLGRLCSATQTPMPQMPGQVPAPEIPRKQK